MSRLPVRLAALAAAGLAFLGPLSPAPAHAEIWSIPSSNPLVNPALNLDEFEIQVMNRINEVRAASGRKEIQHFDSCVDRMSEAWAKRLATTGELVHRDQRQVTSRCDQSWAGEDLIRGELLTPVMTVATWLASPAHREILMKKRARVAGVAIALDSQGRFVGVLNVSDPD